VCSLYINPGALAANIRWRKEKVYLKFRDYIVPANDKFVPIVGIFVSRFYESCNRTRWFAYLRNIQNVNKYEKSN
jgi:hypothetical protein